MEMRRATVAAMAVCMFVFLVADAPRALAKGGSPGFHKSPPVTVVAVAAPRSACDWRTCASRVHRH